VAAGAHSLLLLYRGVFAEDFQSENGPKIDDFGGIRQGKL